MKIKFMKKITKLDKIEYTIIFFVLLFATFAICIGLDIINVGENGIYFVS